MAEMGRGGVMDNLCQAHYFQDVAVFGSRELFREEVPELSGETRKVPSSRVTD